MSMSDASKHKGPSPADGKKEGARNCNQGHVLGLGHERKPSAWLPSRGSSQHQHCQSGTRFGEAYQASASPNRSHPPTQRRRRQAGLLLEIQGGLHTLAAAMVAQNVHELLDTDAPTTATATEETPIHCCPSPCKKAATVAKAQAAQRRQFGAYRMQASSSSSAA